MLPGDSAGLTSDEGVSFEGYDHLGWWTVGGLTRKWRWMSASAGGRPNV